MVVQCLVDGRNGLHKGIPLSLIEAGTLLGGGKLTIFLQEDPTAAAVPCRQQTIGMLTGALMWLPKLTP